jgi:hypothetical protein
MNKELLRIEFRYTDAPKGEHDCGYRTKKITIGIYDSLEEAVKEGNKVLEDLSKRFEVRYDDKFGVNSGCFGTAKRLVTNCCYPTKGVQYFAQITKLSFDDVKEMVDETFEARIRYELSKEEDS